MAILDDAGVKLERRWDGLNRERSQADEGAVGRRGGETLLSERLGERWQAMCPGGTGGRTASHRPPVGVPVLIPVTCGYVRLHGKGHLGC